MLERVKRNRQILGVITLLFFVAVLVFFDVALWLQKVLVWLDSLGFWAPVIFGILYVVATIAFLPGSVLTLGAGVLFGVVWGSVIVSISATLGAAAAFLIGRYFAREPIEKKISGNKKFEEIDDAVGKEGWKIVVLTRLSPIFPFNLQNYAYGLTKVKFSHYFFASWIGMLPGTILYVYFGSLAGSLVKLSGESSSKSSFEWIIFVVGLLATVAVTVYVTRIATKALKKKVE